jgi:large subunit ribosomal protein L5
MKPENPMREIFIEKMVLGISAQPDKLDKGAKLLKVISGSKPAKRTSKKRIPSLGVRPGLEIGVMVTIRDPEKIKDLLRRFFAAVENSLKEKQVSTNTFSFGIKEYIEVEGIEYQRDIGIIGFDVALSFARKGKRVTRKKICRGRLPEKQHISKEEIIKFMEKNYKVTFKSKEKEEESE